MFSFTVFLFSDLRRLRALRLLDHPSLPAAHLRPQLILVLPLPPARPRAPQRDPGQVLPPEVAQRLCPRPEGEAEGALPLLGPVGVDVEAPAGLLAQGLAD